MEIFSSLIVQIISFSIFITITIAKTRCLHHQKALLLELKMQLVFSPPDSPMLVSWNQTPDCCQWGGVECDAIGLVVGLHLNNEAISGGIEATSSPLFRLRHLQELNLAFIWFETRIPRGIGRLTSLTHLNLSNSGFMGQIPHEVSLLTKLVVLDLSDIIFSFPDRRSLKLEYPNLKMLVQNMHSLRELRLDGVNISAGGSGWGQLLSSSSSSLHDLRILSLRYCGMSGPFHPSLSKFHSLSFLALNGNDFFTTIPYFFTNFTRLASFSCAGCSLQGPLPKMIFEMPSLREIDLSFNEFLNGTIPEFNVSSGIRSISMMSCGFGGVIPSTLSNLTELVNLDLSWNFLTGSVPSFHMLEKVKSIELSENGLDGSLSHSNFEGLTSLVYLGLHHNSLSGSIPHSLFALPCLVNIYLDNNRFSGEFMNDFPIVNITSLEMIDLSYNFLNGSIPQFLFTLPLLDLLVMNNNQFSGKINHLSINTSAMNWLDLSSNLVQGPIPHSLFQLRNLSNLILSNNLFTTLPTFAFSAEATMLQTLDLSNNIISGEIPSWIWEIGVPNVNLSCNLFEDLQKPYLVSTELYSLDLHSNQLRGKLPLMKTAYYADYSDNNFDRSIPHSFFANNTSYYILVANNSLSGSIPTSLCNATSLEVLDLSFNRLSDSIPSCLVFEQIKVISLKGNNLNGAIPDRFTVNCSLKTFDLSSNDLGGKIPKSLSNCKELAVFNVGGNNFDDSFPCMLSSSLQVLVLRSNRFHGELRCHKSWPKLQIIDISSNNFSGSLLFMNLFRGMMRQSDGSNLRPNHSSFGFLNVDGSYRDEVTLTVKGKVAVKIVKIWPEFTCIDFSCNNFNGEIPASIGNLSALYLLNLSHNALGGTIPRSLGNLTELGSLDFSFNKLRGSIPEEMARLTFLSVLNLSYNELVGKVPNGRQLQTFATDSFIGNEGLHGFPLDKRCSSVNIGNGSKPSKVRDEEIEWKYVSIAMGYVVGLGSVVWMLLFWRRFRKRYFEEIEEVAEIILKARERRRREARRRVLVRRYEVRRQTN